MGSLSERLLYCGDSWRTTKIFDKGPLRYAAREILPSDTQGVHVTMFFLERILVRI